MNARISTIVTTAETMSDPRHPSRLLKKKNIVSLPGCDAARTTGVPVAGGGKQALLRVGRWQS